MLKKIFIGFLILSVLSTAGVYLVYKKIQSSLPEIMKIEDYKPLLVSQVYDRNGKKVGEFFRERRVLIPYKEIPDHVIKAFIAAEDDQFFQHKGINLQALFRAAVANMRAGRNVQGGSTITQQVAKTLLLTNEKTFGRKIRDILLALQMEKDLTKEDILYLYLNQIYFGQSAYGIEMAAQTYFKKPAKKLTVAEAAMLAGLPKAPSEYSPVKNPLRAKERQSYVLHRMSENKFISEAEANNFKAAPIKVYLKEQYEDKAPFYMETIRQLLVEQLGEDVILNQGVKIVASLDLDSQMAANEAMVKGLKELDKRQGFRGVLKNITDPKEIEEFLIKEKKGIISELTPERVILPNGTFEEITLQNFKGKAITIAGKTAKLPNYLEVGKTYQAIVDEVSDKDNFVKVTLPEVTGYIPFESMTWARKLNPDVKSDSAQIKKPSAALAKGDVILVKIVSENVALPATAKT
ncbi:MAG: transglycosylase domain-containing protein, partial [Bdellovibrionaceae bacterium]|nr:transglycosylase domain-containing protein [Pseudobdellovibrionaceae bacterium]